MRDATARRLSRLHATLFRASRGRLGKRLVNNDMLLLTTRGRRTGAAHTVPLLYLRDGDRVAVIASWGGRDHHPDWYRNLLADPVATLNVGQDKWRVEARTAQSEERELWWRRALAAYSGYGTYQRRTDREIPVVLFEPISGEPSPTH